MKLFTALKKLFTVSVSRKQDTDHQKLSRAITRIQGRDGRVSHIGLVYAIQEDREIAEQVHRSAVKEEDPTEICQRAAQEHALKHEHRIETQVECRYSLAIICLDCRFLCECSKAEE